MVLPRSFKGSKPQLVTFVLTFITYEHILTLPHRSLLVLSRVGYLAFLRANPQAWCLGFPRHSVSNLHSKVGVQAPAVSPALRSL